MVLTSLWKNAYGGCMPTDTFYRMFSLAELIAVLRDIEREIPDAMVGRSGNGTGNLCIYQDGEYVGVVELHDPPEYSIFAGVSR